MSGSRIRKLSGVSPSSDDYYGIRSAQDSENDDVFTRISPMNEPCQLIRKTDSSKFDVPAIRFNLEELRFAISLHLLPAR